MALQELPVQSRDILASSRHKKETDSALKRDVGRSRKKGGEGGWGQNMGGLGVGS